MKVLISLALLTLQFIAICGALKYAFVVWRMLEAWDFAGAGAYLAASLACVGATVVLNSGREWVGLEL